MISRSHLASESPPTAGPDDNIRPQPDHTAAAPHSALGWHIVRGALAQLVAIMLLLGALAPAPGFAAAPEVTITGGRMLVLLPSRPAAGYFTLQNQGDTPLVLSGASAPDCKSLMLHQSIAQGGIASMNMVDSIPVPPHGVLRFSPGSYHLMCMEPSGGLLTHQGTEAVTLRFASGGSVTTPFSIQGPGQ